MRNCFCLALLGWAATCHGAFASNPIWEKLQLPKAAQDLDLYGVCFVDAQHGWIVGEKGLCLTTNDGGATWETKETGSKANLRCVQFRDAQTGWICGDGDRDAPHMRLFHFITNPFKPGTFLHTTDGGKTWKTSWIHTNFEIHCLEAADAPRIVVGTHTGCKAHLDGDFAWSSTGGETGSWVGAKPGYTRGCRSFCAIRKVDKDRWVAVGAANPASDHAGPAQKEKYPLWSHPRCRAFYSEDNGKTWKFSKGSDGKPRSELQALAVAKNHPVLAVGEEGVILRSQDAGATWETMKSPTAADLASAVWCGPLALAMGENGTIVLGKDDGKSWEQVARAPVNDGQYLCSMAVAGDYAVVVGSKGTACRAKIAALTNSKDNHSTIVGVWKAEKLALDFPKNTKWAFEKNGKVTVFVDLPQSRFADIEYYDIQVYRSGQKQQFMEEMVGTGTYQIAGDKLTITLELGLPRKKHPKKLTYKTTIVKLTNKEFQTKDEKGKVNEFTRIGLSFSILGWARSGQWMDKHLQYALRYHLDTQQEFTHAHGSPRTTDCQSFFRPLRQVWHCRALRSKTRRLSPVDLSQSSYATRRLDDRAARV